MNCKQGDLAVVVTNNFGNLGKLVTCLRFATGEDYKKYKVEDPMEPAWVVDSLLMGSHRLVPLVRDSSLRPIRDNPGQDETLSWAPVPKQKETA